MVYVGLVWLKLIWVFDFDDFCIVVLMMDLVDKRCYFGLGVAKFVYLIFKKN